MSERYPGARGYSVEEYFDLVKQGQLDEEDHVELLDGVIVAEPPMDPPRASGVGRVAEALRAAVADRAVVREEKPLVIVRPALGRPAR